MRSRHQREATAEMVVALLAGAAIAAVAALFLAAWLTAVAHAHGDAGWIMRSQVFGWCCSERDCHELPNETVARLPNGWRVLWRGKAYDFVDDRTLPSIDDHFWLCENSVTGAPRERDGQPCFFAPRNSA